MVKRRTEASASKGEVRPLAPRGRVLPQLQSAILAGAFPAGQMLPGERELMRRYGVTRNTIRRALGKLSASGHLTCLPRIGYRVAAAFREGQPLKAQAIGLIWHSVADPSGDRALLATLEQEIADAGHTLMLGSSRYEAEREDQVIRRLTATGMNGLIVAPARCGTRSTELERWIDEGRPVVLHGHPGRWLLPDALVERCDWVDVDNSDGARQIVEMLAGLGHRKLAFVCWEALAGSERFAAFKKWVAAFGLTTHPAWHIDGNEGSPERRLEIVRAWHASGHMPTAVVCSHEWPARWLLQTLPELGLRCPRDLSVTAFGEYEQQEGVALTMVNTRTNRQTQEMMRLLVKQFAGVRESPEQVLVPVSLAMGDSTGPVKRCSKEVT